MITSLAPDSSLNYITGVMHSQSLITICFRGSKNRGYMDPVHILTDPVYEPGPRRRSMQQGPFWTFPGWGLQAAFQKKERNINIVSCSDFNYLLSLLFVCFVFCFCFCRCKEMFFTARKPRYEFNKPDKLRRWFALQWQHETSKVIYSFLLYSFVIL